MVLDNSTGGRCAGGLTELNGKLYASMRVGGFYGEGTIIEYAAGDNFVTTKFNFNNTTNSSGKFPTGVLTAYNNELYGFAAEGGTNAIGGTGTIFKFNPTSNAFTKIQDNGIVNTSPDAFLKNFALDGNGFIVVESNIVLPIKLTNFTAKETASNSNLNWTTSFELNNKGYNIQHSRNGASFTDIGFVNGKGNSTTNTNYNFTHYKPSVGKNYYRLQAVDFDGKTTLSNIEIIFIKDLKNSISIYPNPTREVIYMNSRDKMTSLEIFDIYGRKIISYLPTLRSIDLSNFSNGTYIMKVILVSGEIVKEKIVVKK